MDNRCMQEISVEMVIDELMELGLVPQSPERLQVNV